MFLVVVDSSCSNLFTAVTASTVSPVTTSRAKRISGFPLPILLHKLRGGESTTTTTTTINKSINTGSTKKRKKKKRNIDKAKKAIDNAMKEKDQAEALGDAIR